LGLNVSVGVEGFREVKRSGISSRKNKKRGIRCPFGPTANRSS